MPQLSVLHENIKISRLSGWKNDRKETGNHFLKVPATPCDDERTEQQAPGWPSEGQAGLNSLSRLFAPAARLCPRYGGLVHEICRAGSEPKGFAADRRCISVPIRCRSRSAVRGAPRGWLLWRPIQRAGRRSYLGGFILPETNRVCSMIQFQAAVSVSPDIRGHVSKHVAKEPKGLAADRPHHAGADPPGCAGARKRDGGPAPRAGGQCRPHEGDRLSSVCLTGNEPGFFDDPQGSIAQHSAGALSAAHRLREPEDLAAKRPKHPLRSTRTQGCG